MRGVCLNPTCVVNPNGGAKVQSLSSLKDAIRADQAAAADAGLPRKAQAAIVGVSYGTYCGCGDTQQPDEWPSDKRLERLIDATAPGMHVVAYLAAKRGALVVPVPIGVQASGHALAQVLRETSDVVDQYVDAQADHALTGIELAHCDREVQEAVVALLGFQAAMHAQAVREAVPPVLVMPGTRATTTTTTSTAARPVAPRGSVARRRA